MEDLQSAALFFNESCDLIDHNIGDLDTIESNLANCIRLIEPLVDNRNKRKVNKLSNDHIGLAKNMLTKAQVFLGQLIEWKDSSRAQALYRNAIEIDGSFAEAHTQLGRSIWQLATQETPEDLFEAERLFRAAISTADASSDGGEEEEGVQEARRLLIRLLWQNSNSDQVKRLNEAKDLARSMGYTHILPHAVFENTSSGATAVAKASSLRIMLQRVSVYDNAFPPCMLSFLERSFSPSSPFWRCHGYNSPTTGFFSYQHQLSSSGGNSLMAKMVHHAWRIGCQNLPALSKARYGEWWAHNRYHSNGHRLHYDYVVNEVSPSTPRHPISTCIIYLTDNCGGSTFVTDQTIASEFAHSAYLVKPVVNRMACFDGRLLHSVVPASGLPSGPTDRRVTIMIAFYKEDPGAPNYDDLEGNISSRAVVESAAHHSTCLDWVPHFRKPWQCTCGAHTLPVADNNGTLISLPSVADSVASSEAKQKELEERAKKRRRLRGLNLLDCDKVFTYFEALNSGLVLARKFL